MPRRILKEVKYNKIMNFKEARNLVSSENWELVVEKFTEPQDEVIELLKEFEGYWIKADAIICKLIKVARPPEQTIVYWPNDGGNWHFWQLGIYGIFNLHLPLRSL